MSPPFLFKELRSEQYCRLSYQRRTSVGCSPNFQGKLLHREIPLQDGSQPSMTKTSVALSIASTILSGCVSLTAYNTIKQAESLCNDNFAFEIHRTLTLKKSQSIFFKKRGSFIQDWMKKHPIVIIDQTRNTLFREETGPGKIDEVITNFYDWNSGQHLATMRGYSAHTSPVVLTGHPASYSCDFTNQKFMDSLTRIER